MRARFFLCFWSFAMTALATDLAGAQSLTGRVRDSRTQLGLPFAKVELMYGGAGIEVEYSDSEGRFRFTNAKPGAYTISATLLGYLESVVSVDTTLQRSVDVLLTRVSSPVQAGSQIVSIRKSLVPDGARKAFEKARKEIDRKDCPKAIHHLEDGLRLYDQNAEALNDLGNCRRKLGDLHAAESAFKQAMSLSDAAYIVMNLAETYTAQERFTDAEGLLTESIRKTADAGDLYYALAAAYFKQDRLKDAEVAALQADSREHRVPDLHLLLAKIYSKTNPKKVETQLRLYLSEAPSGVQSDRVRQLLKPSE